ncbi:MAG: hypothetical protein KBT54_08450 [Amphritea sp.]|nr:hypothetical protein [Amphritea sp.]
MYFVVFATDKPGMASARAEARPTHREYLRQHDHPVRVRVGGPTFNASAEQMNGTMLVIEADEIKQVHEYLKGDPYQAAGIFESIEVRPWSWGLGLPEE